MQGFLLIVIILVGIIGLYLGSYVLNSKTDIPEGVTEVAGCDSCNSMSCSLRK